MSRIGTDLINLGAKSIKAEIQHRTDAADKQADAAIAKVAPLAGEVTAFFAADALPKLLKDTAEELARANREITCDAGKAILAPLAAQESAMGAHYGRINTSLATINTQKGIPTARKETIRAIRHDENLIKTHDAKTNNLVEKAKTAGGEAEAAATTAVTEAANARYWNKEIHALAMTITAEIQKARNAQNEANTRTAQAAAKAAADAAALAQAAVAQAARQPLNPAAAAAPGQPQPAVVVVNADAPQNPDAKVEADALQAQRLAAASADLKHLGDMKGAGKAAVLSSQKYESDLIETVFYHLTQDEDVKKALKELQGLENELSRNKLIVQSIVTTMQTMPFVGSKEAKAELILRVLVNVNDKLSNPKISSPGTRVIKMHIATEVEKHGVKLGADASAAQSAAKPVLLSSGAKGTSSGAAASAANDNTTDAEATAEGYVSVPQPAATTATASAKPAH